MRMADCHSLMAIEYTCDMYYSYSSHKFIITQDRHMNSRLIDVLIILLHASVLINCRLSLQLKSTAFTHIISKDITNWRQGHLATVLVEQYKWQMRLNMLNWCGSSVSAEHWAIVILWLLSYHGISYDQIDYQTTVYITYVLWLLWYKDLKNETDLVLMVSSPEQLWYTIASAYCNLGP